MRVLRSNVARSTVLCAVASLLFISGLAADQSSTANSSPRRILSRGHPKVASHGLRSKNTLIDPSPIPSGWTCSGNCGTDSADGVVQLSPAVSAGYEWVSTSGGANGVGALPTGALGGETNGSTLTTPLFAAIAGTPLNFYFNFVTTDGAGFADYAWAELYNSSNTPVALLFTARTSAAGDIVPGAGMPIPLATLTPTSVPIISGPPTWLPLGGSSGGCYDAGCGYTGWVQSSYTILTAGTYYLRVGVTNWADDGFDTGLAVDGVTVGGVTVGPVATPALSSWVLIALGAALILLGTKFVARNNVSV